MQALKILAIVVGFGAGAWWLSRLLGSTDRNDREGGPGSGADNPPNPGY